MPDVRVAVVTGGHTFDVPKFHRLFRSLEGVEAFVQHLDDYASSTDDVLASYDVVVFYFMPFKPTVPADDGLEWFEGKPKSVLEKLGASKQGVVVLHHAILAWPDWDFWKKLVGIEDRAFTYDFDQSLRIEVADAKHPITKGLKSWDMVDEAYGMKGAGEGSEVLLTCRHPRNLPTIAWTRQFNKSRVFCLQSGHDPQPWADANFREVLRRGILWSAGRL